MKKRIILIVPILCIVTLLFCNGRILLLNDTNRTGAKQKIYYENATPLVVKEGLVCEHKQSVKVFNNKGEKVATINMGEPIIVVQAEGEEPWGNFQFPLISRTEDNNLLVSWQMCEDSYKSYGKGKGGKMMSRDEGCTWTELDKVYFSRGRYAVDLPDGTILNVSTPVAKEINNFVEFPKAELNKMSRFGFYEESKLPEELRGVYFQSYDINIKKYSRFHAEVFDPGLLRDSIDGKCIVMWWGDMKLLCDNSIVAGIYPTYYKNTRDSVSRSAVSFYNSVDNGLHWKLLSKIPFPNEDDWDAYVFNGYDGFAEPVFEILKDSTFICILRTGDKTPMYKTFSADKGRHWTTPESFTPNGVLPRLLLLDNGVLVLSSGRPGVQLRFSIEGDGKVWTEPIDLLPIMGKNNQPDYFGVSCGYTSMIAVNANTFYIVYSNFISKSKKGENRKAIMFRKIEIRK